MNFFGLGPGELLVIAVLALVVVGPTQLPSLLKQMGGWFGKAQELQRELRRGVDDIVREAELDDVTKTITQVRNFTPTGAATNFLNKAIEDSEASSLQSATTDNSSTPTAEADKAVMSPVQASVPAPPGDIAPLAPPSSDADPVPPASTPQSKD